MFEGNLLRPVQDITVDILKTDIAALPKSRKLLPNPVSMVLPSLMTVNMFVPRAAKMKMTTKLIATVAMACGSESMITSIKRVNVSSQ